MTNLSQVMAHMDIVGADGVHIGTVDQVEGNRIKLTKADSGWHGDHHHYVSVGLTAAVEGNQVRLSEAGSAAVQLGEEEGGEPVGESEVHTYCFQPSKHVDGCNQKLGSERSAGSPVPQSGFVHVAAAGHPAVS